MFSVNLISPHDILVLWNVILTNFNFHFELNLSGLNEQNQISWTQNLQISNSITDITSVPTVATTSLPVLKFTWSTIHNKSVFNYHKLRPAAHLFPGDCHHHPTYAEIMLLLYQRFLHVYWWRAAEMLLFCSVKFKYYNQPVGFQRLCYLSDILSI